jgi:hypothetical protein
MLLASLVFLAAQTSAPVAAPVAPPLEPEKAPALEPDHSGPAKKPGTFGGVTGAATGCVSGFGGAAVGFGAGGGILYWMYASIPAGLTGWTPACTALGISTGMCTGAVCFPMVASGATAAGAVYGIQQDGRDPFPALLGALPGLGLGALATTLGLVATGIGAAGSLAAVQTVAIVAGIAIVLGIAAAPCTACGAGIADLAWGNQAKPNANEEPLAGTGAAAAVAAGPKTAMRF